MTPGLMHNTHGKTVHQETRSIFIKIPSHTHNHLAVMLGGKTAFVRLLFPCTAIYCTRDPQMTFPDYALAHSTFFACFANFLSLLLFVASGPLSVSNRKSHHRKLLA
jgi:hypothetical protein